VSRRPDIAVVGSLNVDLTLRCDRLPNPGETITGWDFTQSPGGQGANQALAAARLGANVGLVGRTGADAYAEVALRNLREAGVDLTMVTQADSPARAAAPAVTAVNTVGAGNTFVATFVVGLVEGRQPGDALQRACVAAALTVTREGAQTAMPTAAQVDDWRVT
jgi:ribokinase